VFDTAALPDRRGVREPRQLSIACGDGAVLSGELFEPQAAARAAIVIHGATAVPCRYYRSFARWLAGSRTAAVVIYDYRDYGSSARVPPGRAKATMAVWGVTDQDAALGYVCRQYPDLPIEVIGHSLGGMFLAFHRDAARVRRLTAVASGPVHWTRHPLFFTPAVVAFWFGFGPLLTTIFGYLPGRRIGLGADVPAGVYWQWRRWCLTRGFHRSDWGRGLPHPDLRSVRCPVRAIAVADDAMMPPGVVGELGQFYPFAPMENRLISPREAGCTRIGHLRVFSERCRAVWPVIAGGDVVPVPEPQS